MQMAVLLESKPTHRETLISNHVRLNNPQYKYMIHRPLLPTIQILSLLASFPSPFLGTKGNLDWFSSKLFRHHRKSKEATFSTSVSVISRSPCASISSSFFFAVIKVKTALTFSSAAV